MKILNPNAPLYKHRFWFAVALCGLALSFANTGIQSFRNAYDLHFQTPIKIVKEDHGLSQEELMNRIRELESTISAIQTATPSATPEASIDPIILLR
jgi:hypothetical protein